MTVREELLYEISKDPDELLRSLLPLIHQEKKIQQVTGTIEDLQILDPYQAPRIQGIKDSFLDIKVQLHNKRTVIIEMQVLNVLGFGKRVLYNAAKAFSIQLDAGESYAHLNPVVALTIADFELFLGSSMRIN